MFYYAKMGEGHKICHVMSVPFELDADGFPQGEVWLPCPGPANYGDALFDGVIYPCPPFGSVFNAETKEWHINEAARIAALDVAKQNRIAEIDTLTNAFVQAHGLPFGGARFALSDAARLNYKDIESGLKNAQDLRANGILSEEQFAAFFPVPVITVTGDVYRFNNPLELQFFFLALATYQSDPVSPLVAGRNLKARVMAATTIEELEAIVDDRE